MRFKTKLFVKKNYTDNKFFVLSFPEKILLIVYTTIYLRLKLFNCSVDVEIIGNNVMFNLLEWLLHANYNQYQNNFFLNNV